MLKEIVITKTNIELAMQIQRMLFPEFSARVNYRESVEGITENEYFLLMNDNGEYVGISGIYYYEIDRSSAWLGWFGILPAFRHQRYGSTALRLFEERAIRRGYKHVRLYTDKYDNDAAIGFYEANGYLGEEYRNADDPIIQKYPVLIYSKNLQGEPLEQWNDRYIDLTSQVKNQLQEN